MLKDFKEFALRGNVVDMAVGIIVGAAFGTIVNSLVSDILMPPIGILLGNVDFSSFFVVLKEGKIPGPYPSPAAAKVAGAVGEDQGRHQPGLRRCFARGVRGGKGGFEAHHRPEAF